MARVHLEANPIFRAEVTHQRRSTQGMRGWRRWLGRGLYVFMLLVSLIVYFGEWAGALLWRDTSPIHAAFVGILPLLVIYGIGFQLMLMLKTLALAANSVSREWTTGTWDLLVLSGIDGWRIVVGKWLATLRATRRDWLLLIPIRVGLVTFIGAEFTRDTMRYMVYWDPTLQILPPSLFGLLLIVPVLLALTFANAAVIAACGLLASALVRRAGLALAAGMGLAVGLVVLAVIAGTLANRLLYEVTRLTPVDDSLVLTTAALGSATVTAVDNGTTLSVPLISYRTFRAPVDPAEVWHVFGAHERNPSLIGAFWLSLAVSLAGGGVLVWTLLRLARRVIVRTGALERIARTGGRHGPGTA